MDSIEATAAAGHRPMSQQKIASQQPRGTRLDPSGTHVELKGARNYTSYPLFVGANEMYEDIVMRGLRADGLSSKLGVKNHKEGISKLISGLFKDDPRHDEVMLHFHTKRQKSNSAKSIFSTITGNELKLLKSDLFPTKVDVEMRNNIGKAFSMQPEKLHNCLEVLKQLQTTFKHLESQTDLVALHNFKTRGFFGDLLAMMADFMMQVLEDVALYTPCTSYEPAKDKQSVFQKREDATAAEILLSVGSDVQPGSTVVSQNFTEPFSIQKASFQQCQVVHNPEIPQEPVDENKDWVTVEMVDSEGGPKYLLVKTPKGLNCAATDTEKILQLLGGQSGEILLCPTETSEKHLSESSEINKSSSDNVLTLTSFSTNPSDVSQPYLVTSNNAHQMTTLEISLTEPISELNSVVENKKRRHDHDEYDVIDPKKEKT
ncbi:unnamed protein product [Clavelina lepadiformis]|uniref:Uncharacterized protein n=1 Tax=Clavelina lepadiformis TaxID=159417 RepID=A0ABP0GS70_CLALP